jgi:hypothetical protein
VVLPVYGDSPATWAVILSEKKRLAGVGDVAAAIPPTHLAPANMHLEVDVNGAAGVPAGVDGLEPGDPVPVRELHPAEEVPGVRLPPARGARASPAEPRIDPECVGVPDIDRGADQRLAATRVDDASAELQGHARLAFGDVAADALEVDVIGAFGQLRRERTGLPGFGGREGAIRLSRSI